jgi:hypothetical protein
MANYTPIEPNAFGDKTYCQCFGRTVTIEKTANGCDAYITQPGVWATGKNACEAKDNFLSLWNTHLDMLGTPQPRRMPILRELHLRYLALLQWIIQQICPHADIDIVRSYGCGTARKHCRHCHAEWKVKKG